MRCLYPRTVGFRADGKTITWSLNKASREYPTFPLPCGRCIDCRIEYSHQWATRCVHESKMFLDSCFITLTYNDENLPPEYCIPYRKPKRQPDESLKYGHVSRLHYKHIQDFIKRLRSLKFDQELEKMFPHTKTQADRRALYKKLEQPTKDAIKDRLAINYFVTGEYGDTYKRPHWHLLIFNYSPSAPTHKYTSDRGDRVYESDELTRLWSDPDTNTPYGMADFGEVTYQSASYVARYAAKKLEHGNDYTHDFEPISKKSSHYAIGKRWLEKYHDDIFNNGFLVLDNGTKVGIPRYYEKWLKKHHFEKYIKYCAGPKARYSESAALKLEHDNRIQKETNFKRRQQGKLLPQTTRLEAQRVISTQNFNRLKQAQQENSKC